MTSKRDQIIRLRTENPILRLTKIAEQIGVDQAYVHRVLKKADLPTKSILINKKLLPRRVVCQACREDVPKASSHSSRVHHIHDECRYEFFRLLLTCRFCQVVFRRKRSAVKNFVIRKNKHLYCSVECRRKGQRNDSTYDLKLNYQLRERDIDAQSSE
jgi:tRNA U34 5-carboxymethylaminomethyl modifying enzyme MnmG/GidA